MKKKFLLILILLNLASWAQAPNISYPINTDLYPNDQGYMYATNTVMNPLIPVNTGGTMPNAIYGQVTTVAGSGFIGTLDGIGTAAGFYYPIGIAVDVFGNIYVADRLNHKIRKINPAGVVSTFAGSGVAGAINGIGTEASFNLPWCITIDLNGNLFVGDTFNNQVRKITQNGVVSTFATGLIYPRVVAVGVQGEVYVGDYYGKIKKISITGVVSSFAGNASFDANGIAVDALGNLNVSGNNKIIKITPSGLVSTIAGSGITGALDGIGSGAGFNGPSGVAVDALGNLYVADSNNQKIRKITTTGYYIEPTLPPGLSFDMTNGVISGTPTTAIPATTYTVTACNTYGSSSTSVKLSFINKLIGISYSTPNNFTIGTAITSLSPTIVGPNPTVWTNSKTVANISSPAGIAIDSAHNLYVTNYTKIMKITPTGIVSTFAGSGIVGALDGVGTSASFNGANGIAIDLVGNLYVAEREGHKIRKITPSGVVSTLAGSGVPGAIDGIGTNASFKYPQGVTVDLNGTVYIADSGNLKIRKITSGAVVSTFAGSGTLGATDGNGTLASFKYPTGITVDRNGYFIYVCDLSGHKIRRITNSGLVTTWAGSGSAGYTNSFSGNYSSSFNNPQNLEIDGKDNVYVADSYNNVIRKITQTGIDYNGFVSTVPFESPSGGGLNNPSDVAVDGIGSLYVADFNNNAIKRIVPPYIITPCLPLGLNFNTNTGIISGTPTEASPATTYTVTTTYNGNPYVFNETSSTTIVISTAALGVNDFLKNPITLFPNPTNSLLNLSINDGIVITKVTIVDITGKVVLEQKENLSTINVEKLAKGVYILTAYAGDKKYQEKFIKE